MKIEYVFTASEIKAAKDRLAQLRQAALLSRDAQRAKTARLTRHKPREAVLNRSAGKFTTYSRKSP